MLREKKIPIDDIMRLLPAEAKSKLLQMPQEQLLRIEEIRMRTGRPISVLLSSKEMALSGTGVEECDLRDVLERATQASLHTALEQIRNGFVTIKGGHRIGLCGTVVRKEGETATLRYISSISIRIAKEIQGQAPEVLQMIAPKGMFESTLILGAPGCGKTTLLREIIKLLSNGTGSRPHRVGVADERSEIAALWRGIPQFDIGRQTDVLDGCPKSEALITLLRGMNPQVLAVDEVSHPKDIDAMLTAFGCGAEILATAHSSGIEGLRIRPLYRRLMNEKVFRHAVVMYNENGQRSARVELL